MQENIINLIDENGVESQFEIILSLEAEGKEYAILMPVDDEDAEEALVLHILYLLLLMLILFQIDFLHHFHLLSLLYFLA